MGSQGHNMIYKKVCLEQYKSRVPGLISCIDKDASIENGNWGLIPYDLKLNEIPGLDALKAYLTNKHYGAIKVKCSIVDGKRTTETDIPEWYSNLPVDKGVRKLKLDEPRLRYKDLMLWYYWILDLCKKSEIYEYSINNADILNKDGYWVLMDNFNVFDKEITDKTKLVFNFNEEETIVDGEVKTSEWEDSYHYIIVTRNDKEFFDNHGGFELVNFTEKLIGRFIVPKTIVGNKVPDFIYYSEVQEIIDYMNKLKDSNDCCLKDEYIEMGGDEMLKELGFYVNSFENEIKNFENHNLVPYIDIPVALTCDIDDLGVMFNDEQEWIEGFKYQEGDIVVYNGISYKAKDENTGKYDTDTEEIVFNPDNWVEYIDLPELLSEDEIEGEAISQLHSFKSNRFAYTDDGTLMEGCLPYDSNGNLIINNDGYIELDYPFKKNTPLSITEYIDENGKKIRCGDILHSIDEKENIVTFKYGIGVNLNNVENSGIQYEESYIFSWQETREMINGEVCKIKYRQVNYDLNVDNGSMGTILSKVRHKRQHVWNKDYKTALTLPTFRKDYLLGLTEYPSEDVRVVIDRGISHAFEKHLMLSETNTFEDLKNYKNNYFNLQ